MRDGLARMAAALRTRGPDAALFWLLALGLGIASGLVAVGFRFGIDALQSYAYAAPDMTRLHSHASTLPWGWLVAVPVAGGLAVGLILHRFTPDARVRAVADVIQGAALNRGRVELREGLASAAASLITLGTGGSSGREGPVVHLAAVLSTWVADRIRANGITGRELLGCAVAAGVSASFNAPIAGAIFALEVVLRHYAIRAFAPIAIASVAGAVISRSLLGDVTEFRLGAEGAMAFHVELPAFLLLGLVCGLVAVALMKAVFWTEDWAGRAQARSGLPRWMRPTLAGALLGLMAIPFPQVIGVGYETTSAALTGALTLQAAVTLAVVKTAAVAVTLGGRMGGGVFSPALMLGALTGLAFGHVATAAFPEVSGSATLYALAGMGAVSAAVLGAPISTTLIVFELTGDWQTGIAVMAAVSLSTALASRLVVRSYFLTQIARRDLPLAAGPQAWLPAVLTVGSLVRPIGGTEAPEAETALGLAVAGRWLAPTATLAQALPEFERSAAPFLPVMEGGPEGRLLGVLYHLDALQAVNRALAEAAAEEHA